VILTPGGPGYNVVALDKMNGDLVWSIDLDSAVNAYNSPVLIRHLDEDFILLNTTEQLILIRPQSGEIAYSHPIKHNRDMHAISALYQDGTLLHSSGYGIGAVLLKLNESNGGMDTLWYNRDLDCRLSGLINFNGTVFGTSDRKKQWVGVDLESGKTLFTTRELKPGSFLMADNQFLIFTEMGEVALATPAKEGFSVISRFHIPVQPAQYAFAHPVIHKGILYIRYRENIWLYALGED
jgi:outer membrane protein assembly factor BamB